MRILTVIFHLFPELPLDGRNGVAYLNRQLLALLIREC